MTTQSTTKQHLATMVGIGLLASMACARTPLAPTEGNWQPRGIGGGGALFSVTISPHQEDTVYMATDMSTVFRTSNFGETWDSYSFQELQGSVDTEVRFTADPQVLYTVFADWDGYRIPYKSVNGGQSWQPLASDPTDQEAYFLDADPERTNRIIVASYDTIYLSDDGGETFNESYAGSNPDYGLRVGGVHWDDNNIMIGTQDGLVVSTDGGDTFTTADYTGIPQGWDILSLTGATQNGATRLYALTRASDLMWPGMSGEEIWDDTRMISLDWGESHWTDLSDLPEGGSTFFIQTARNDIDTVYTAGGDTMEGVPRVYKSTNGGASWDSMFHTEGNQNISTGWCGDGGNVNWWWAEMALGFAVAPNNPDRLVMTDFGFVHVSSDGGMTWRQAYVDAADENPPSSDTDSDESYTTNGIENTSVWWLHWHSEDDLLAAFTDVTGLRSVNGGDSWTSMMGMDMGDEDSSTDNIYQFIEDTNTGTIYAPTASVHDIYQSLFLSDERLDFTGDMIECTNDEAGCIDSYRPQETTGRIIYSIDGGQTWDTLRNFGEPVVWLEHSPNQPNRMYASIVDGDDGGIYMTNNLDQGSQSTWTKLADPPRTENHPFNIHELDDGTLVATYSGRTVGPEGEETFTASSGIFVSENGGASWIDRSHPNMMYWTKDIVIDPHDPHQDTWYVGVFSHWGEGNTDTGGIYRTTDRGLSWQRISDLARVDSMTVNPADPDHMYATTETKGLWETHNLRADDPTFSQDQSYPFRQPLRVFFNPHDPTEVWTTSFGGGLKVQLLSPGIATDLDGDGQTTLDDALICIGCMNAPESSPTPNCASADLDQDGDVDLKDFQWFSNSAMH
ncbi:MAG: dockerin type I domain-containing protein [Planctomycetota bacterium]|jgi:photosystem II stability/assembly factor-like uncharacterized protein